MQLVDGDASCCPQEQQTPVVGRKEIEGIDGKTGGGWVDENREDKHGDIEIDHVSKELAIIEEASDQGIVAPTGPGTSQTAVGAGVLIDADEFSTIWTQYRMSVVVLHINSRQSLRRRQEEMSFSESDLCRKDERVFDQPFWGRVFWNLAGASSISFHLL